MKPPGRACGRNDMVGLLEPPPTSSIPGRANRAPLSPAFPGYAAAGAYEIRAVLPEEDGRRRYRIKSLVEPHERVVSEDELSEP